MVNELQTTEIQNKKSPKSISPESSSSVVKGNLEDLHAQAELAHRDYLQARMKVVSAYREKDLHDAEVYREVELDAQKLSDTTIEKAIMKFEERVKKAAEAYYKEREEAGKIYRRELMEALGLCRETTERAWKVSRETSEQIWKIFQGNGVK